MENDVGVSEDRLPLAGVNIAGNIDAAKPIDGKRQPKKLSAALFLGENLPRPANHTTKVVREKVKEHEYVEVPVPVIDEAVGGLPVDLADINFGECSLHMQPANNSKQQGIIVHSRSPTCTASIRVAITLCQSAMLSCCSVTAKSYRRGVMTHIYLCSYGISECATQRNCYLCVMQLSTRTCPLPKGVLRSQPNRSVWRISNRYRSTLPCPK